MHMEKKGRIMSVVTVVAAEKLIIAVPLPWQRDRPGGVEGWRVCVCVCVCGVCRQRSVVCVYPCPTRPW